eukprot:2886916-Lingulodinium_polyedra.AAC.1
MRVSIRRGQSVRQTETDRDRQAARQGDRQTDIHPLAEQPIVAAVGPFCRLLQRARRAGAFAASAT